MTPQVAGEAEARWSDLMTPALAPRAALILLGVWLNAADALVSVTIMPTLVRESVSYTHLTLPTIYSV